MSFAHFLLYFLMAVYLQVVETSTEEEQESDRAGTKRARFLPVCQWPTQGWSNTNQG